MRMMRCVRGEWWAWVVALALVAIVRANVQDTDQLGLFGLPDCSCLDGAGSCLAWTGVTEAFGYYGELVNEHNLGSARTWEYLVCDTYSRQDTGFTYPDGANQCFVNPADHVDMSVVQLVFDIGWCLEDTFDGITVTANDTTIASNCGVVGVDAITNPCGAQINMDRQAVAQCDISGSALVNSRRCLQVNVTLTGNKFDDLATGPARIGFQGGDNKCDAACTRGPQCLPCEQCICNPGEGCNAVTGECSVATCQSRRCSDYNVTEEPIIDLIVVFDRSGSMNDGDPTLDSCSDICPQRGDRSGTCDTCSYNVPGENCNCDAGCSGRGYYDDDGDFVNRCCRNYYQDCTSCPDYPYLCSGEQCNRPYPQYLDNNCCEGYDDSGLCTEPVYTAKEGSVALMEGISEGVVGDNFRVGLVSYNSAHTLDASIDAGLSVSQVSTLVRDLSTTGFTNVGAAMKNATDELAQKGREQATKIIVFFSDGIANRHSDMSTTCDTRPTVHTACSRDAMEQANKAKNGGIIVYTIGVLLDTLEPAVAAIARDTLVNMASSSARYFDSPTKEHLYLAFQSITENIVTTVTAPPINCDPGYIPCSLVDPSQCDPCSAGGSCCVKDKCSFGSCLSTGVKFREMLKRTG